MAEDLFQRADKDDISGTGVIEVSGKHPGSVRTLITYKPAATHIFGK